MRRKARLNPNVAAVGLFLVGMGLCACSWPDVTPEGAMFALAGGLIPILRFTLREFRKLRQGDKARRRQPMKPRGMRRRSKPVVEEDPREPHEDGNWLDGMDANGDLPGAGDCVCDHCPEMNRRRRQSC
jgi:hypothetical protein